MDFIDKLAQYWSSQGLASNGGASAEMVRSFEDTHGVKFPEDFADYLLRLNGLAEFGPGADQNGFGFISLRRLRPVAPAEYPPDFRRTGHFVFAEYLDWSWGYALQIGDGPGRGEVIHVATLEPKVVAPSFRVFVDRYIADAPELYPVRRESLN